MRIRKLMTMGMTLLVAIITLVTSVNAASLSELQTQESTTQKNISDINSKIQVTLQSVNNKYQEVNTLKSKIQENESNIEKTQTVLNRQKAILATRTSYAKKRLQSLQKTADNRNIVNALLSSDSLSDFLNRAYALTVLQSADNENMSELSKSYAETQAVQEELARDKDQLVVQKDQLDQQTADLQTQVKALQTNLQSNQAQLTQIAQQKKTEEDKIAQQKADAAKAAAQKAAEAQPLKIEPSEKAPTPAAGGKTLQMQATAYSIATPGMGRFSATGMDLLANPKCIAVDPSVIPLGSVVFVTGYGYAVAGDTGSAIKGNIIDLHFPTLAECTGWGRRSVSVTIMK